MTLNHDQRLLQVLERAQNGLGLTRDDCIYLLKFDEASPESSLTRSVANDFTRKRLNNAGVLIGQIGVDIGPCVGGCKFCVFAAGHTKFEKYRISDEELVQQVEELTEHGDLYGLYLMTMHLYDKDNLLHMIDIAKNAIHPRTRLWVNIGDTDLDTFKELKKAGVSGAYHVCRLREGIDTKLQPEARLQTMRNILAAEIELQTCCEPIGPEHSVEEVVDNFFIGVNMGAISRACMRRTPVPGTPFENSGQISQLRLAQFCAVISLAAPRAKGCKFTSVHEPNQAGFISGANLICAESGANPRDTSKNTQENIGWTTGRCRKLLLESGFSHLILGDDTLVPLTLDYLKQTNSI